MSAKTFDHETLSDPAIRQEFTVLQKRAEAIGKAVCAAYGDGRKPITFRFVDGRQFNARAGKTPDAFFIEINAAVPLFHMVLFSRLLSDKSVLPYLDAGGPVVSDFGLPFVIDPFDFERRADWRCQLNDIRAFAAGTMADICSTFAVCHEFGHIISGHVEARHALDKSAHVSELISRTKIPASVMDRLQAWEYEADFVGSSLMARFIEALIADCQVNPRTREMFKPRKEREVEHALAVALAALFAFFMYVQGMRVKLGKTAAHPHPMVRAHYIKSMLLKVLESDKKLNLRYFHRLLDQRLDEVMAGLERLGIFDGKNYSDDYVRNINAEVERLRLSEKDNRRICAPWSWITWG